MSYGSGIDFTGIPAAPSASTLTGADNGLSPSTVTPGNVVLGQDVSEPGNPADLLSDREIRMLTFALNLIGGQLVLSDVQSAGDGATRFQIIDTISGAANNGQSASINAVWNTPGGQPSGLVIAITDTASLPGGNTFIIKIGGNGIFAVQKEGAVQISDPVFGAYCTWNPISVIGGPLPAAPGCQSINNDIEPSSGNRAIYDLLFGDNWGPTGGSNEYRVIHINPRLDAAGGTGQIRMIYVNPQIVGLGSQLIAFENETGDVLLNSVASANIGRVGMHAVRTPTAYLHIGAGAAAASSAPIKLTTGPVLTTPENGAIEFTTPNFFVTAGGVRYTLAKTLTTTAVLNFPSTAAGTSSDLTIALTGATSGDVVSLGIPSTSNDANSCYTAFVSAANTVTVRFNNYGLLTAIDPASGTYRIAINKY